jgi:hypothetical protein
MLNHYSGYIFLVLPTSQHPPALLNISNVAASHDPNRSPPKKKNTAIAVAARNNPSSSDVLVAATLAYAHASDPNSGNDVYDGDCNLSAELGMAVEAVESSFASASAMNPSLMLLLSAILIPNTRPTRFGSKATSLHFTIPSRMELDNMVVCVIDPRKIVTVFSRS